MLCIYSLWFHFLTLVLKCWQQGENFLCPSKLLNGGAWSLSEWRQGDCKRKLKLKGNRFALTELRRWPGLPGLPAIQRTVVCSGGGQRGWAGQGRPHWGRLVNIFTAWYRDIGLLSGGIAHWMLSQINGFKVLNTGTAHKKLCYLLSGWLCSSSQWGESSQPDFDWQGLGLVWSAPGRESWCRVWFISHPHLFIMFREKIFYFCGSTPGKLEFGFEIWQQAENCSGPSLVSDLGLGPGMKRNMESVKSKRWKHFKLATSQHWY